MQDLFQDIPASQALRAAHLVYNETMSALAIDRQRFRPVIWGNFSETGKYEGMVTINVQLANGLMCAKHYDNLYSITRKPDEQIGAFVILRIARRHFV